MSGVRCGRRRGLPSKRQNEDKRFDKMVEAERAAQAAAQAAAHTRAALKQKEKEKIDALALEAQALKAHQDTLRIYARLKAQAEAEKSGAACYRFVSFLLENGDICRKQIFCTEKEACDKTSRAHQFQEQQRAAFLREEYIRSVTARLEAIPHEGPSFEETGDLGSPYGSVLSEAEDRENDFETESDDESD